MFDLETAIATWRHVLKNERALYEEDLDELERHVRDQIPWLMQKGLDEESAFRRAIGEMGDVGSIQSAYRDVFWKKTRHRRRLGSELSWRWSMLKNYLKITFRLFARNPIYSTINVTGLSLGLASCIVILLFVLHERSFDRFHSDADNIYRVYRTEHRVGSPLKVSEGTMSPLAPAIKESIPGVLRATHYLNQNGILYSGDNQAEVGLSFVDPDFLEMFDFSSEQGSARLDDPSTIVFTASAAQRYFPGGLTSGDAVDLLFDGMRRTFTVTDILPDPPANSSFQFELLLPYSVSGFYLENGDSWTSNSPGTYVQLAPETSHTAVSEGLARIVSANMGENIQQAIEAGWLENREDAYSFQLQPLREMHLTPGIDSFTITVSDSKYSYILLAIAFGILLIACINFMTIALGRAVTRSREVGMRKSLGAARRQVMAQFWGEALVMSVVAAFLGVLLARFALPVFNQLADRELTMSALTSAGPLLALLALTGICAFFAGLYPSVLLSGFKPINALRASAQSGLGGRFSRMVIVFQFVISIGMIAAVLTMRDQMRFIERQDLGFSAEQVVVVPTGSSSMPTDQAADLFQERVAGIPGVLSVSGSSSAFGSDWSRTIMTEDDINHIVYTNRVDPSFLETLGIRLIDGRNLSDDFQTDARRSVLVNRAFVDELGWDDPVGRLLPGQEDIVVVGVVDDYKFLSIRERVPPVVLHMNPDLGSENFTMVRFRLDRLSPVIDELETIWRDQAPDQPFVAQFMDERLAELYANDRRWQTIITYASGLALLISCLGLFGVAALSSSQRRKEIGVRKVLGASVGSIVLLLSRDFARLVGIGFVIAVPVAWYVMDQWLDTFAYKVSVSVFTFVAAGAIALLVALATVSRQSIVAAVSDPTESLRSD